MTRPLLLVLSFIGIADSWYLYQSAVTDTALSCDIGAGLNGCNIVAQSPYSQLFGVPLALYGVGFFALVFVFGALLYALPNPLLRKGLLAVSAIGAAASAVFLFIQFALIKALCIYCLLSAILSFTLLYLAWRLQVRRFPASLDS